MAKLDYELKVLRESAVLTNSYVASTVRGIDDNLDLTEKNQVILLVDFTIGSLTSVELKAEFSPDNVNFFQETSLDISGWTGTVNAFEYTITATWKLRIAMPIKDKYMKISAIGTWTVTGSLLEIQTVTWLA